MPILLLSRGDQDSRNLLKQAITARYGHSAPMIDTVKIDLKGRSRVKLAFASTWMHTDATLFVKFPSSIRWDFTVRPVGLPVTSSSEAFDGEALRRSRMLRGAEVHTDTAALRSSQSRIWMVAVMLLTPLSDPAVQLAIKADNLLEVTHTTLGVCVHLLLNDDKTLNRVTTRCYNPLTEREQLYTLQAEGGQHVVNNVMLPSQINVLWDTELDMEMMPLHVDINPPLNEDFFKL